MAKIIDMTGWKMNEHGIKDSRITVLERDFNYKTQSSQVYWKCKCDCGNVFSARGTCLRNGTIKSCKCYQKERTTENNKKDLIGVKFGRLIVLNENKEYKQEKKLKSGHIYWNCKCICGNNVIVDGVSLRSGLTQSCGCLQKEKLREATVKNLKGQIFGFLTVIEEDLNYKKEKNLKNGNIYWKCFCNNCQSYITVNGASLRNGLTNSCGCIKSKGELKIKQLLKFNNIIFEEQKTFESCRNLKTNCLLKFDFYINNSFLVEFDGVQHFNFSKKGWNTEENFHKIQERDLIKNNWCRENNIPLKRIPYWALESLTIEDIMGDNYLTNH